MKKNIIVILLAFNSTVSLFCMDKQINKGNSGTQESNLSIWDRMPCITNDRKKEIFPIKENTVSNQFKEDTKDGMRFLLEAHYAATVIKSHKLNARITDLEEDLKKNLSEEVFVNETFFVNSNETFFVNSKCKK